MDCILPQGLDFQNDIQELTFLFKFIMTLPNGVERGNLMLKAIALKERMTPDDAWKAMENSKIIDFMPFI
jgi:hypothetical protein